MGYFRPLLIAIIILGCQAGVGQANGIISVQLLQLTARPQRFDKAVVTVRGFLVVWTQPGHPPVVDLYNNEGEVKRPLAMRKQILVIPSEEMIQSLDRIKDKYICVTGTFHAVRSANGSEISVIKNIKKFIQCAAAQE